MNRSIVAAFLGFVLLSQAGYAEGQIEQLFSDDNKLIQEDYKVDGGALAMGPDGFARHTLEYDERGNVVREAWLDDQLNPVANKDGVYAVAREYNEANRVAVVRYLDAQGNPMLYEKLGAYGESFEYDQNGNVSVNLRLDATLAAVVDGEIRTMRAEG